MHWRARRWVKDREDADRGSRSRWRPRWLGYRLMRGEGKGGTWGNGLDERPGFFSDPIQKMHAEGMLAEEVVEGMWNSGDDGKPIIPDLQLVWTGRGCGWREEEMLRGALGEESLKATIFWLGLGMDDREVLAEERKTMDDKTADGWLKFLVSCRYLEDGAWGNEDG